MGENTAIEWAHHTFNPWIGCTKVSEGCRFCYAESQNKFRRWNGGTWGPGALRRLTSEANWRKPLQWDREARQRGVRERVFCASLADVFDTEVDDVVRDDLFFLIDSTTNLDWLLLTKRPENAQRYLAEEGRDARSNVWLGTSVENQKAANERIPVLLQIPAHVRFLSIEPLLGPVDLLPWLTAPGECVYAAAGAPTRGVDWVIVGGESGSDARPMHPAWARSLRDQCAAVDVPFLFKQWGEWTPGDNVDRNAGYVATATWSGESWFVGRENLAHDNGHVDDQPDLYRVGKKASGRVLDGRTWDEFPEVQPS